MAGSYQNDFTFLFTDRDTLDLSKPESIAAFFEKHKPVYFVNCAAYTAVDKAETEQEAAYTINAEAVGIIAKQCRLHNCTLLTISTDYVFDGKGTEPYQPGSATDPVNYYGYTKWMGEKLALENNPQTIVIRTSWVYGSHGNNFVKTMLRVMKEKKEVKVVNDQTGSPTNAADLAEVVMQVIQSLYNGNTHYGIYHFTNKGVITWYDFATAIKGITKLTCEVLPIPTTDYPLPAKRPAYSLMNTDGIEKDFGVSLKDWKLSLQQCLDKLK